LLPTFRPKLALDELDDRALRETTMKKTKIRRRPKIPERLRENPNRDSRKLQPKTGSFLRV